MSKLAEKTGYDFSVSEMEISLADGLAITAYGFRARVREKPGSIVASKVRITFDGARLLKGQIVPTKLFLDSPKAQLVLKKGPDFQQTLDELLNENVLFLKMAGLQSVSAIRGEIRVKNFPFALNDLTYSVSKRGGKSLSLLLNSMGKVKYRKRNIPFSLHGTIASKTKTLKGVFAYMDLTTGKMPLKWFPQLSYLPIRDGLAGIHMKFRGTMGGALSADVKVKAENLKFSVVLEDERKNYSFPKMALDFNLQYFDKILRFPAFKLRIPETVLSAEMAFDFQNASNPHMNLKIRNPFIPLENFREILPTPLLPSMIQKDLFPIFAGGKIRLDDFSLKGTLNEISNLDSPKNSKAISVRLTWRDVEALRNSEGMPFRGVSGRMILKKGDLKFSEIKGKFGNSRVKNGSLNIRRLFYDIYDISAFAEGSYKFEDIFKQRKLYLLSDETKRLLEKLESVSGNLNGQVRIDYKSSWKNPRIVIGEFQVIECNVFKEELVFPLLIHEGKFRMNEDGQNYFKGLCAWGNSRFEASGSVDNSLKIGKAEIVAKADMDEIFGYFFSSSSILLKFKNAIPCKISMSKKKKHWACNGEIGLKGASMILAPFSVTQRGRGDKLHFDLEINPEAEINFKRLRFILGKSVLELSGIYDLAKKKPEKFRVLSEGFFLEDLGVLYRRNVIPAKGQIICNAEVEISPGNPFMTSVSGDLKTKDISFSPNQLIKQVTGCNMDLRFTGQEILINAIDMRLGDSELDIKGNLRGWAGFRGDLTFTANDLKAEDFAFSKPVSTDNESKLGFGRFLDQTNIGFRLKANGGSWRNLRFNHLALNGSYRFRDLYIKNSKIRTEHGIMTLKGHMKKGKKTEIFINSHVILDRQPVGELLRAFGVKGEYVKGTLSAEGLFITKGRQKKDLIPALDGFAGFFIEKGEIRESGAMVKILDFLSLQNIFTKRPPDFSKEGLYFENISGNLFVDKGIIVTKDLFMQSPVFNAAAQGKIDLHAKKVDYDIGAQPLGTMDSIFSNIPILGYILTGKEKSLLVYYFNVKGSLGNPEVKYVPGKNWATGTLQFLKRIFFTPRRLLLGLTKNFDLPEVDDHLKSHEE